VTPHFAPSGAGYHVIGSSDEAVDYAKERCAIEPGAQFIVRGEQGSEGTVARRDGRSA
jgi:hypothetical protein